MPELSGWLLDLYAGARQGIVLWLAGDDGRRHRLTAPFPITFFAGGPFPQLRALWRYLARQPIPVRLRRCQRRDLFAGLIDVMAIEVDAAVQPRLFQAARHRFPQLDFYDADIPLSVRFAAQTGVFPLSRCQVRVDEAGQVQQISPLTSRWQIDAPLPDLRMLTIEPDSEPAHRPPQSVTVSYQGQRWPVPLRPFRLLLTSLHTKFKRFDPDLILTRWGDTWLFPTLARQAQAEGLAFHPSRDPERPLQSKQARSYFTYGQVIFRGQQTYLFGRWHIDVQNAMMYSQYRLPGVLEQARVTGMPVQEMARRSPGAGITAMQMIVALQRGILVPYTKQQAEYFKSARHLFRSDRGGLVYQPEIGLFTDVAEIDFVSMYPSIIDRFNISPETVAVPQDGAAIVPELGIPIDQSRRGLLPETLRPLLVKRAAMKARLATMSHHDCRYAALKARATALKWLLVVAFGYAGYKRARFGRIEAHEAITAYSREAMLRAKEVAEAAGFTVLHLYVDGLWLHRPGVTPAAVAAVLADIQCRTGLPIALEGIYRWLAFLPSRQDARIPVPNRFFGAFTDGELKIRGIEARRRDTPPFIARLQQALLHRLAQTPQVQTPDSWLPGMVDQVRHVIQQLRRGQMPLADLLVSQTLSRELDAYRTPSPAARAARQLQDAGKRRHPGQRVRFIYVLGEVGVYAWDLPHKPEWEMVDRARYIELMMRAVGTVLRPFDIETADFHAWVFEQARQVPLL